MDGIVIARWEAADRGPRRLTEQLSPDRDSEVDLDIILKRSLPIFTRLIAGLRAADDAKEATPWLDNTDKPIKRLDAA